MTKATYYLTPNAAGTVFMGTGYTPDGTVPKGAIPCTQEQAQNWQQYVPSNEEVVAAPDTLLLAQAQTAQKIIVKQSFTTAANANITDANGITWEGGMSSSNSIFLACQLAQQTNQTNITLYDASKKPHSMTVAEGMAVASLIGEAYQKALGTKNSLYANIDAASTVSAVQKVTWPS